MAETRTYTLIIKEQLHPLRDETETPYRRGFRDEAAFREWLQAQLDGYGPFDAEYSVSVSK